MVKLIRMEWEKPYKEALIDALRPFGDVLLIGFGLGYAAGHIQTYQIKSLTIIESDPHVADRARQLLNVRVIEDTWDRAMAGLGVFDAIFLNDIPLQNRAEAVKNRDHGNAILKQGKEVVAMVKQQIPELTSMRYSDHDIDEFFEAVGRTHLKEVPRFLAELKHNGQISEAQYERIVQKYQLERREHVVEKGADPAFVVLEACLNKHMRKGSRFSCFSCDPTSKYEDAQFFEHIITNPNVDYEEKVIPVEVPLSCEYYPFKEALVLTVEKGVEEWV